MFKLPKIENSEYYYTSAIKIMEEYAEKEKKEINTRWSRTVSTQRKSREEILIDKQKDLELQKVRYLNGTVNRQLRKIVKKFPKFSVIKPFYHELIETSDYSVDEIQKAIDDLNSLVLRCDEISQMTLVKLKKAKTHKTMGYIMKKHLGKIGALYDKSSNSFVILYHTARFMNKLPELEDLYTVAIGGFPNVGKSTLMKNITGSDVEIRNYPFTTKGLMFGYIPYNERRFVQLIDTPGLLGRETENKIEKRASVVLEKFCSIIVFVIDLTTSCGYTVDEQIELFKSIQKESKEIIVYFSKVDLYGKKEKELRKDFEKKFKNDVYETPEVLSDVLVEKAKSQKKKFDPSSLKVVR